MASDEKEFVVTDAAGQDHVFPVGTKPEDAMAAIRTTNMARGQSATGAPVAGTDLDKTWSEGFHGHFKQGAAGAKQDSTAGFALGLAEGAPGGVVTGVKETLKLPFTITRAVLGGTADLVTDPAGTYEKVKKAAVDLPDNVHKAFQAAIDLRANDPEEWGKAVGAFTGAVAGGKATGAGVSAVKQPVARGVGTAMVKAAEHPLATRLTGGGMLGRAIMTGDPMLGAGGVALMGAPSLMARGGRALQEYGGMEFPTTAREIGAANTGTREIAADLSKSKPIGVEGGRPNEGTTRVPYSGQAPDPYRSAAKAAAKATSVVDEGEQPIFAGGKWITRESHPTLYEKLAGPAKSAGAAESAGTGLAVGETASEAPAAAAPKNTTGMRRIGGFMSDGEPYTPSDLSAAGSMGNRARQGLTDAGFDLKPGGNLADELVSQEGVTAPRTSVPNGRNARPGVSAGQSPTVVEGQTPPPAVDPAVAALEAAGEPGVTAPNLRNVPNGRNAIPGAQGGEVVQNAPPPAAPRPPVTRVGGPAPAAPVAAPVAPAAVVAPAEAVPAAAASSGPIQGSIRVGGKPGSVFAPKPISAPGGLQALWQEHGAEEAGTLFAKQNPGAFGKLPKTTRTNLVREAMAKAGTPDAGGLLPESAQAQIDKALTGLTTDTAKRAYLLKAPNSSAFNYIFKMLDRAGLAAKFATAGA